MLMVMFSLNELTIPKKNYNINGKNNTLVLRDYMNTTETFTITAGNYTVSSLKEALNTAFAAGTFTITAGNITTAASTANIL